MLSEGTVDDRAAQARLLDGEIEDTFESVVRRYGQSNNYAVRRSREQTRVVSPCKQALSGMQDADQENLIRKYLRDIGDNVQLWFRSDDAQVIIQHLDNITRRRGCQAGSKKKNERASLKKLSRSKRLLILKRRRKLNIRFEKRERRKFNIKIVILHLVCGHLLVNFSALVCACIVTGARRSVLHVSV